VTILTESNRIYNYAESRIVLACQSHRRFDLMGELGYPLYAQRADGARFWDVDGNEYLDYLMGFGPIVIGHNHPVVNAAVRQQMDEGTIYSLCHPLELEVADLLIETIPAAEMVGFFIGGSGATSGAVRIARAYTGRDRVIKCGYHGWHDWTRPGDPGVPDIVSDLTTVIDYGDVEQMSAAFQAHPDQTACVIVETIQRGGAPEGYLQACVDIAHQNGALCVFDETKVGFRVAFGGGGEIANIAPDLSTFGKAISNGYPGSFVAGRKEILAAESTRSLWMTATFQSDLLSLAAIKATVLEMRDRDGITYQWDIGKRLMTGVNAAFESAGASFRLIGPSPMPTPSVEEHDREACYRVLQTCLSKGHYLHPTHPWFLSLAHTEEDIDTTVAAIEESIAATL
jgi:glutamate-1-semialdehyde aminotransferase